MFQAADAIGMAPIVSAGWGSARVTLDRWVRGPTTSVWRAFGLRPQLVEHVTLSPDPQFIAKVRDVVGLDGHPSPDTRQPHRVPNPYPQLGTLG